MSGSRSGEETAGGLLGTAVCQTGWSTLEKVANHGLRFLASQFSESSPEDATFLIAGRRTGTSASPWEDGSPRCTVASPERERRHRRPPRHVA